MRNIQKNAVQMINVREDNGEKFDGEIQNRVVFTKDDNSTFTILLNDDERNIPETTIVAISEKLKLINEDYLTIEEMDLYNSLEWVDSEEERVWLLPVPLE